jgi:hypothetical protein
MKHIFYTLLVLVLAAGCNEDLGNYDYDYGKVPKLELSLSDTVRLLLIQNKSIGDTMRATPNVSYPGREGNLVYRWFVTDYPYQTVTEGNAQVWPVPDTISRERDLEYIVDFAPGRWFILHFMARDTVNNAAEFITFSYIRVNEAGAIPGVYCLQEKDGQLDIDVIRSSRALVLGAMEHLVGYYGSFHPTEPLTGTPLLFNYTGGQFYIFTSDAGLRVNPASMVIMDRWEEMFYTPPATYAPGAVVNVNSCTFLVNDGRLHLNYTAAGDRKFSNAIPGDYRLAPFLATATIASWLPVTGAINAHQIVHDEKAGGYRPFFNRGTSLGQFLESDPTAVFDVNNCFDGEIVHANTVNAGETMSVIRRPDGSMHLLVSCFYNVVDNRNLARRDVSLAGCADIASATCFASGYVGPAFFYGAGNTVHSFSYTTGQTTSNVLWQGDPGEEITAIALIGSGGFPTSGRILWIAAWNEAAKTGRLVEFEINPVSGLAEAMYAPMFSGIPDNPYIHEGLGKVRFMTVRF